MKSRFTDTDLAHAIANFNGVPTPGGLGNVLGATGTTIERKLVGQLRTAYETRGRTYLASLDDTQLLAHISKPGWCAHLPEYAKDIVDSRLRGLFLQVIEDCTTFPSVGYIIDTINTRYNARMTHKVFNLRSNPELTDRLETKGKAFIASLGDEELKVRFTANWHGTLPAYAKAFFEERFTRMLLDTIASFQGAPNFNNIAAILGIEIHAIINRAEQNNEIERAMVARGIEHISSFSDEDVFAHRSRHGWVGGLLPAVRQFFEGRTNKIILAALASLGPSPSYADLNRRLGHISADDLIDRIRTYPDLWLAWYAKQGLSPDQAVELALGRSETSEALIVVMSRQLTNLYAYREMAGLIRCFGDVLTGQVLAVTLYPKPLEAAAADLGVTIEAVHIPMQPFRQGTRLELPSAQAVIVQSIHRLAAEGLNALLEEVHKALPLGKKVILTHSVDYAPVDGFIQTLKEVGFELATNGTLVIEPPSADMLHKLGADTGAIERIRRKIAGESCVLVFTTVPRTGCVQLPALVKLNDEYAGKDVSHEVGSPIIVPEGSARQSDVRFVGGPMISISSQPFLVELTDGAQSVALVGYDVDLRRPGRPEFRAYPGAPSADYLGIARRLAQNTRMRRELGITPTSILQVPLTRFVGRS
jgi:hypothetical protein